MMFLTDFLFAVTPVAPIAAIGTTEWLLIAFVVILLFGARKLPELARSMGSSVNEFKKGMADGAKPDEKSSPTDLRSSGPINGIGNGANKDR